MVPGPYTRYAQYARNVAQLGFVSTSFFCFLIIILTTFFLKRKFGSYKYLLIVFPACGIVFASIEFLIYPDVYFHNTGYVFYSTSHPFYLDRDSVTCLISFYTGVYACTTSLLSVQFLYRYWAVFHTTKLKLFKGWKFFIWMVYALFFGILWCLSVHSLGKRDDYSENYMRLGMKQKYNLNISDISAIILVTYNADGSIRWRNFLLSLSLTSIMLVQYTIIIYCAVQMYLSMEEKLQIPSPSLRNLHNQFFKTLVLQIVTPTITLFSPVVSIIHLPMLNLELDLPTGIFLCAFTLYPAMDAIIVMYVVQDYRRAVKYSLRKLASPLYEWLVRNYGNPMESRSQTANVPNALY